MSKKVFVALFSAECNEHIPQHMDQNTFSFLYGQDMLDAMGIQHIFQKHDIELIPSIYARHRPFGMIDLSTYEYIKKTMLDTLREHIHEIDGVYLHFHGASGVDGLDCVSGEHDLIKEIRKITGNYMPIAMTMDPHGNITHELTDRCNIVRCYRESPHSDAHQTAEIVAEKLCQLIEHRRPMKPLMVKLPILIGGEMSQSKYEPVVSINQYLDNLEKDERVFSSSFHVGYIRHDDDKLGVALVVIPNTPDDIDYCREKLLELSDMVFTRRKEFTFQNAFGKIDESIKQAVDYPEKTVVITDSGDNCGAGGSGECTQTLSHLLKSDLKGKKTLVAGINDPSTLEILTHHKVGEVVHIDLGSNRNELTASIPMDVKILVKGKANDGVGFPIKHGNIVGEAIVVEVVGTTISIIVVGHNVQYGNMEQFESAGVSFHDYDIVVVKMGYLDTYLIPETSFHTMALSLGPTIQNTGDLDYKKIARPMWPKDEDAPYYFTDQSL